jgi:hypothetical protein
MKAQGLSEDIYQGFSMEKNKNKTNSVALSLLEKYTDPSDRRLSAKLVPTFVDSGKEWLNNLR